MRSLFLVLSASAVTATLGACSSGPAASDDPALHSAGVASCAIEACEGDCLAPEASAELFPAPDLPALGAPATVTPEVPLPLRRARVAQKGKFLGATLPAHRTTTDGRVARIGDAFATVKLEQLADTPLVDAPPNLAASVFGSARKNPGSTVHASLPNGSVAKGAFICQPELDQPKACGADDCYELRLVQVVDVSPQGVGVVLESIPLEVRVKNPKTGQAEVESATFGAQSKWAVSPELPFDDIFEPLATADGRLLIGRLDNEDPPNAGGIYTYRLDGGGTHTRAFSLFYAWAPNPCGVGGWAAQTGDVLESIRPISAAPYDRRLKDGGTAKYGIAAYPMRDHFGDVIGETDFLSGSYPWIDRSGNVLVFSSIVPAGLQKEDGQPIRGRYPMRREKGALAVPSSPPRGFSIIGSWTQGKAVTLDSRLNNEDYGFQVDDDHVLGLYQQGDKPWGVLVNGGGRDGSANLDLPNLKGNGHHLESLENQNAVHPKSLPVTPRDVVWDLTRGVVSEEVAFDDFMDPHLLVFAQMNAATVNGTTGRSGRYLDGFTSDGGSFQHDPGKIRVQSSATSTVFPIAREGRLEGEARIEPVALGGVRGRGLWLDDARLRFDLPAGTAASTSGRGFYVGVFVDTREAVSARRHVWSLTGGSEAFSLQVDPGGALVLIHGGSEEIVNAACGIRRWTRRWHHLGALFEPGGRVILSVDGNPVGEAPLAQAPALGDGDLVIGGARDAVPGLRGWYDEARLLVGGQPTQLDGGSSAELLCNYALGTMAGIALDAPLRDEAEKAEYAQARYAELGIDPPAARLPYCVTDYRGDYRVGRNKLPQGALSLRDALLHEGAAALTRSQPRPDMRQNGFCTGCHIPAAQDTLRPLGLIRTALTAGEQRTPLDPRTQPLQPPSLYGLRAVVRGHVPAGFTSGANGAQPKQGQVDPFALDLLLPP